MGGFARFVAFAALEVPPPKIAAGAFILMDFETGQVIAEQDADVRLPPASLAKIMTGFVIFRALDEGRLQREREIEISTRAWKTGGSRMFIEPQLLSPSAICCAGWSCNRATTRRLRWRRRLRATRNRSCR